jgi:hypothetical protein
MIVENNAGAHRMMRIRIMSVNGISRAARLLLRAVAPFAVGVAPLSEGM